MKLIQLPTTDGSCAADVKNKISLGPFKGMEVPSQGGIPCYSLANDAVSYVGTNLVNECLGAKRACHVNPYRTIRQLRGSFYQ